MSKKGCLISGGVGCLVVVLAIGISGWLVARNMKNIAIWGVEKVIEAGVAQSDLPPDQQQAVMTEIKVLTNKIRTGELTAEQVAEIVPRLMEGPIAAAMLATGFDLQVLATGHLPDDAVQAARTASSRLQLGLAEGRINPPAAIATLDPVLDQTEDGTVFRRDASPEAVAEVAAAMTRLADEAGIPEGHQQVNLATVIRNAIQRALEAESH